MVAVTPATFKLWVSGINVTIFAIVTQIVRAIAFPISMASMLAMMTVANAIASGYFVTFLTAPVTVSFNRSRTAFFD